MYAVLMAGGSGTRFWPKSRENMPKQLLNIIGTDTMIQATVARIEPLIPPENVYVVIGQAIEDEVRRQLANIPGENVLVEPCARNTAPCIGLAAVTIQKRDPQGVMVVLPADHAVEHERRFLNVVKAAARVATEGPNLVTLGIVPTRPETGYGYIRRGERLQEVAGLSIWSVEQFVEKPDLERARSYAESGEYFWNSGMFVWSVSTILEKMQQHMPQLYEGLIRISQSLGEGKERETVQGVYESLRPESVDYGIMEKAENVLVIPGNFGWSDVGSWASLAEVNPTDAEGNVVHGLFVGIETADSVFVAPEKLVAAIGVKNIVVVDTGDALLVCSKDRAQDVKTIVEELKDRGQREYL
ncbi:MAG: mannose-1-phosphate guanylyltransferase [Gemmatimonadota bacterium]|nr:MAG: mannose-1-phosphate guanylyltransferase [Gemmatimonadota bacterium]